MSKVTTKCGTQRRNFQLLRRMLQFAGLVVIQIAWFASLNSARPDDKRSIENLNFSVWNGIDQDKISKRNRIRPFFFNIENLTGHSALPFTVDKGSDFHVWLDERVPKRPVPNTSSARSLALDLRSELDEDVKDKVFFDAIPWKSNDHMSATGDQNERFVSFDMALATPYDAPKYWVIHLQAWQCCGGHPPFAMTVLPNESDVEKITLELTIRNDTSERVHDGQGIQIAKFSVNRDRWFHVALDLKPSIIGAHIGKVRAWLDGKEIVDWKGNWGYAPTQMSALSNEEIKPDIGLDFGIYRRRQVGTQTVLIDNIRYGTAIESIDVK